MAEDIVLDSPARWKAVSHPLRLEILRVLQDGDRTNEELADALAQWRQQRSVEAKAHRLGHDALNVASGKLYFHTKTLLKAGLIELAGTRQKGPLTEKLYRTRMATFTTPPTPGEAGPRNLRLLQQALQLYQNTWKEFGDLPHYAAHRIYYLKPEDVREIQQRLDEVVLDFCAKGLASDTPGAQGYAITALLHGLKPED